MSLLYCGELLTISAIAASKAALVSVTDCIGVTICQDRSYPHQLLFLLLAAGVSPPPGWLNSVNVLNVVTERSGVSSLGASFSE